MADLKIEVESDIGKVKAGLKYVSKEMGKLSKGSVKTAKDVKKVSKVVKDSSDGYDKLGSSVKKTDSNMKKFTTTMNKNAGGLRRVGVDANRTAGEFQKLSKTISSLGFGKLAALYGLSDIFAKALQGASDTVEVINMFNVAMGEFSSEVGNYLTTISENAGLDPTVMLEAAGNYTILARSMGLSQKNAVTLGKSLSQLSLDLSSLYNTPIEQVLADLRSGLQGQTETISRYGLDITEASLRQEALRLGIEKTFDKMTQAEKIALRYSIMINKSSLAHGDFAKTIETPANQLRILSQQFTQLSRTIGTVFLNTLGKVLPYINGFIMVLRVLIETLAGLLGYETPKFQDMSNGFSSVTDSSNKLDDSIKGNADSAKKLQKELKDLTLGFDELNIIPDQSTTDTGGASGGGGVGGASGEIPLPDLTEYSAQLENVRMKATEIRDRILEWLGFTKEIDPVTGQVSWKLKDGYTNLEKILDIVKLIGIAFLAWKIAEGVLSTIQAIQNGLSLLKQMGTVLLQGLNLLGQGVTLVGQGVALVAQGIKSAASAALNTVKSTGEWITDFDKKMNESKSSVSKSWNDISQQIMATLAILESRLNNFLKLMNVTPTNVGIALVLVYMVARFVDLYNNSETFRKGLERLKDIFDGLLKILTDIATWLSDKIVNFAIWGLEKIKNALLDMLPPSVREPVEKFFNGLIELIKKIDLDFVALLATFGGIALLFTPAAPFGIAILAFEGIVLLIKLLGTTSDETWNNMKKAISDMWEKIKPALTSFFDKIGDIIKLIIELVEAIWNVLCPKIKDAWNNIIKPTIEVSWKFIKSAFDDIMNAMKGLLDFLIGVFTGDWERAWNGIVNTLKGITNGMISTLEATINGIITLINYVIKQINKIKLPDWLGGGGFNISEIESVNLPKLELAVGDLENKVNEVADKNKPTEMQKSLSRSSFMTGGNLVPNYSNYNRSIPQMSTGYLTERQNDYIQNGQQQTQTETIINNVVTLDGEVIWKNQEKVKAQKGFNFGNPAFSR